MTFEHRFTTVIFFFYKMYIQAYRLIVLRWTFKFMAHHGGHENWYFTNNKIVHIKDKTYGFMARLKFSHLKGQR